MPLLEHILHWRSTFGPTILRNVVTHMPNKTFYIHDQHHMKSAYRFAYKKKDKSLSESLRRVRNIAKNRNGHVKIFPDFAPHSFTFVISTSSNDCLLAGGIIYHGSPHGSSMYPTYATNVSGETGWVVHT